MSSLIVHCLPLGPLPTNAFVVVNTKTSQAIVIDVPPSGKDAILSFLEENNLTLKAIFLTHGHWDHYADAAPLSKAASVPLYAHKGDKLCLENPLLMKPFSPWGTPIHAAKVDHWVEHAQMLSFLGEDILVLHVPGHAPGSILFYFNLSNFAVVGDAIFKESIGRTDLIGGNYNQLIDSIKFHIYSLPDSTILYPGHGEATSVMHEKHNNPFVKG